jgi:hypothetical protein
MVLEKGIVSIPRDGEGPETPEEEHSIEHGNDFLPIDEETRNKWEKFTRDNILPILGNLPKGGGAGDPVGSFLRSIIEIVYQPKVDWKHILQEAVEKACGPVHYTFNRPSRRFVSSGIYIPARVKEKAPCEIAIGVDTSGSISDEELSIALKEIDEIVSSYPQINRELSWISTEMDGPHILDKEEKYEDNPIPIRTTGGTYLAPFFKYYAEHDGQRSKDRVIAIFSDIDLAPDDKKDITNIVNESGLENIYWITTRPEATAPVGKTIKLK